jgi:8-oxo-dGTP diphosphatase
MTIINATLIYVKDIENKKTLMLHRVKKNSDIHKGKWNGVGGKFEGCESPEECAIRETKEETGLDISKLKLRGILTFPKFLLEVDWIVFVYEAYEFSGEIIECNESELSWIDDEKVLDLNLWEGDKIFLPWVFEGRLFSAKFKYIDKKLSSYSVEFY